MRELTLRVSVLILIFQFAHQRSAAQQAIDSYKLAFDDKAKMKISRVKITNRALLDTISSCIQDFKKVDSDFVSYGYLRLHVSEPTALSSQKKNR